MFATKEIKKQNNIHAASGRIQAFPEMRGNIRQPSGLTDFNLSYQRNLGNSFLQSIAGGQSAAAGAVPELQRKYSCEDSCSDYGNKEDESLIIQPKLIVGPANDVYEQEADRVAKQVTRMPDLSVPNKNQSNRGINIQRLSNSHGGTQESPSGMKLTQSGSRPLPSSIRQFMEPRFGFDFNHVLVYTDRNTQQVASRINARAYTFGNHIGLNRGESENDRALMAHELTHVVQQDKNGTVPYIQRWSYGVGTHATSGGNTFREIIDPDEREGANGMDAAMALVDRLVNGTNWRARNCQKWFDDNCLDPRTLSDLHSRAVIWMWREADGSSGNGLTDGGNGVNHAVTEQLFNIRSRWALAATILHEYWHDCDTGAPADIGDDAKVACGLPNI